MEPRPTGHALETGAGAADEVLALAELDAAAELDETAEEVLGFAELETAADEVLTFAELEAAAGEEAGTVTVIVTAGAVTVEAAQVAAELMMGAVLIEEDLSLEAMEEPETGAIVAPVALADEVAWEDEAPVVGTAEPVTERP